MRSVQTEIISSEEINWIVSLCYPGACAAEKLASMAISAQLRRSGLPNEDGWA